jgi:membrane-bound lytic murein transglycosylase D
MLGLAQFYFPIFEERLDKYNMPLELKYLAIVESAMNPNAVSPVGATGLWQFMYGTGKMFGLNVTSYVDDRRDPYKATEAACQYFKFLYDMFHDWQLVLAAYNSGPGNVNKAIRRSGGRTNFWEIKPFLPKETQGYVPAFIAVAYVMNYTKEHNLYPIKPKTTYYQVDTVKTREQVSFRQIAEVLSVPMEDIEYLNPMYKHRLIPNSDQGNTLVLPIDKIGAFITNESSIYAYKSEQEKLKDEMAFMARKTVYKDVLKVHKVRRGESLASIARKYDCTSAQLKKWNHLKSGKVPTGKRINVYVKVASYEESLLAEKNTKSDKKELNEQDKSKEENSVKVNPIDSTEAKEEGDKSSVVTTNQVKQETNQINYAKQAPKVIYYRVQKGDTLWRIAQKYDGVSVNDLRAWNKLKGNQALKAGTKIKVNLGT